MRILLSILFLVNMVFASVAVVSAFKGSANIYRDNHKIKVYVGIEINEKDNIKTNNNTKIQLIFKDNTRITIGKNSNFSVEEYLYDETKPSASKAKFRFTKGLFRTISGRIGKINKKQFKIRVKSATIGIRGTKFDVYVNTLFIKIGVYEGAVYFENNSEQVNVQTDEYFVYEEFKNKKIIKKGVLEESEEFNKKKKNSISKLNKENKNISSKKEKLKKDEDSNTEEETQNNESSESDEQTDENVLNEKEPYSTIVESEPYVEPEPNTPIPGSGDIYASEDYQKEIIDDGNHVDIDDIADLDYGYWQDKNNDLKRIDTFITGTLTPDAVIDNYITDGNSAEYRGGLSSIITDSAGVKTSANGTLTLNINFGTQAFNGNIMVNEGQYSAVINSGTVNSSGFNSSDISNDSGQIETTSGTMDGSFYGTNGDSVGGKFTLEGTDSSKVEGVFGGAKQ